VPAATRAETIHGATLALFLGTPLAFSQGDSVAPSTTFDRVVNLELFEDDPALVEGQGPTQVFEYEVEFTGTLQVWTASRLDLFLQVDDVYEAQKIAQDADSGGGDTPYLLLDATEGDHLAVLVAGKPGFGGEFTLHLMATPETEATLAAAAMAREAIEEAGRLFVEGDRGAARDIVSAVVAEVIETPGSLDSREVTRALMDLGTVALQQLGLLEVARDAMAQALRHRRRTLPPGKRTLVITVESLAAVLFEMRDITGARALQEEALVAYRRYLPEGHRDVIRARGNLAASLNSVGDYVAAAEQQTSVVEHYERTLASDDLTLLMARENLATMLSDLGDLDASLAIMEEVLAVYEATLSEDDDDLIEARDNMAVTLGEMGHLDRARELYESVLAAYERILPADHPSTLRARANLASSLRAFGDLDRARALGESVLASYEGMLPDDHDEVLRVRENLGGVMSDLGDYAAARALIESVLTVREKTLPEDHEMLTQARENMAAAMFNMGDFEGARPLRELALASLERTLPAEHWHVQLARNALASSLFESGDLDGAMTLQRAVLEVRERILPAGHPDITFVRQNLAVVLHEKGEVEEALSLMRGALEWNRTHSPEGHKLLQEARKNTISMLYEAGEVDEARTLLAELAEGIRSRAVTLFTLAPREAWSVLAAEAIELGGILSFEGRSDELVRKGFELVETLRMVPGEAARSFARFSDDTELAPILAEAAAARRALNDLVVGGAGPAATEGELTNELRQLTYERDRLERRAAQLLAERGVVTEPLAADRLATVLEPTDLAVGFRRYRPWTPDESGRLAQDSARMAAFVLTSDGSLVQLDLGLASEFEEMVTAWRTAISAPLLRGLGLHAEGLDELELGRELRKRLVDPILAAGGEGIERLFVCADDMVFLLPLDALSVSHTGEVTKGDAPRLGDTVTIVNEVSFARLLAPTSSVTADATLLALGGVDYDARGSAALDLMAMAAPVEERPYRASGMSTTTRSALPAHFQKLLQSQFEVEATAALFEEAFGSEPTLLTRAKTTKQALFDAAPRMRYLHLATHGWFASETVHPIGDRGDEKAPVTNLGISEHIRGLAPMTLCGLALAGANRGLDSFGRVTGILTAEELCSLDLSQCELAVLSACETNVGIRRAGQGIQSLQAALYAAGARTSITSLWKVDDAATRRLFEAFYTNLWIERMPKAESLWAAKKTMRDEGHPPANWAGWVLTGEP